MSGSRRIARASLLSLLAVSWSHAALAYRPFNGTDAAVGAIWQVRDNLSIDVDLRGGWIDSEAFKEIRVGVTIRFGVLGPVDNRGSTAHAQPASTTARADS